MVGMLYYIFVCLCKKPAQELFWMNFVHCKKRPFIKFTFRNLLARCLRLYFRGCKPSHICKLSMFMIRNMIEAIYPVMEQYGEFYEQSICSLEAPRGQRDRFHANGYVWSGCLELPFLLSSL